MKLSICVLFFLLFLSCNNDPQQKIEVVNFRHVNITEKEKNSASSSNFSVTLSTSENFEAINEKMSFGFVAVEKREDFELPKEELVKKQLMFEVVDLKKLKANQYQFFINSSILKPYKVVYCRFERPGFVLKDGYHSPIFELKIQ